MGVKAFSAVRDHEVHFHQLDKKSGARVRYVKVSGKSGDPLEKDDIEMGYEVRKGKYVTFSQSELDELQPASTRTLDVSDFVALADVDPIYYDRTYWLVPDGEGADRAYRLLLAAMEDEQRVGVGTVVMRNKQYLAAIRPLEGALAMSTLRFADDVVAKSDIDGIPPARRRSTRRSEAGDADHRFARRGLEAVSLQGPVGVPDRHLFAPVGAVQVGQRGNSRLQEAAPRRPYFLPHYRRRAECFRQPGDCARRMLPAGAALQARRRGQPHTTRTEPIAADARPGKDGKNNAKLKLIAGAGRGL